MIVPSRRYIFGLEGLDPIRSAPLADAGLTPYRAVRQASRWLTKGRATAVVLGVGALGQFAIQYLKLLTDAYVVAVDLKDSKLQRATELGADEVEFPTNMTQKTKVVLDFVGSNESLALASRIVERGGVVMQIGEAGGSIRFGMGFVPHESCFTTSIWGSKQDLSAVLQYARKGELEWDVETVPLENINEALSRVRRGDVLGRLVVTL